MQNSNTLLPSEKTGQERFGPMCIRRYGSLLLAFAAGVIASSSLTSIPEFVGSSEPSPVEKVDFHFQILGIETPRQSNKTLNVFVRFRYRQNSSHCPYSTTDNLCIQYQQDIHSAILSIANQPTPELPVDTEWERVNLAICRYIFNRWKSLIVGVSTAIHVNGDGRSAAERGTMPYEPGAHGSTCTIGPPDFSPVEFYNRLPNYGDI